MTSRSTLSNLLLIGCIAISSAALVVAIVRDRNDGADRGNAALEARVNRLEDAFAALPPGSSDRNSTRTHADASHPAPDTDADVMSRLAALEDQLQRLADSTAESLSGAEGGAPGEPEVTARELARTRQALDVIQRQELSDQITRWVDREAKQSKELVASLGKQLNLSASDADAVALIFREENTAQAAMLEELWTAEPAANKTDEENLGERWDRAAERMREFREERDKKLRELLGPERFSKFERMAKGPLPPETPGRSGR